MSDSYMSICMKLYSLGIILIYVEYLYICLFLLLVSLMSNNSMNVCIVFMIISKNCLEANNLYYHYLSILLLSLSPVDSSAMYLFTYRAL